MLKQVEEVLRETIYFVPADTRMEDGKPVGSSDMCASLCLDAALPFVKARLERGFISFSVCLQASPKLLDGVRYLPKLPPLGVCVFSSASSRQCAARAALDWRPCALCADASAA